MRKNLLKWVAFISIPIGILFACKEYDEKGYLQKEPQLDRATEIANAKSWYESQAAVRSRTRASLNEEQSTKYSFKYGAQMAVNLSKKKR